MSKDIRGPVTVEIGGNNFVIHRFDAFEALRIFGDLQREILPAVGGLLTAALTDGKVSAEADTDAVAQAIEKLSTKLDGKQLEAWVDRLITKDSVSVELNGNTVPLSSEVRGLAFSEFTDILELLVQVLKVNFAGPLMGFLNRFGVGQINTKTENQ